MHIRAIVKWLSNPCFIILVMVADFRVIAINQGALHSQWYNYPFFVAFTEPLICGGVLLSLNPAWVLTAKHCLPPIPPIGEITVKVMRPNLSKNLPFSEQGQPKKIVNIIRHPSSDIALVQLKGAVRRGQKIPIAFGNKEAAHRMFLGIGYQATAPAKQDDLKAACALQHTNCTIKSASQVTLLVTSYASLCHGDSGGPLLITTENKLLLIGILSRIYNVHDVDPFKPTCPVQNSGESLVYNAFVQISSYLDWISDITQLSRDSLIDGFTTTSHAASPKALNASTMVVMVVSLVLALLSNMVSSVLCV